MKKLIRIAVLCLGITELAMAEEPVNVPLASVALTNPGVVLTASSFNADNKENPIVCYMAFGSEVILPKSALIFSGKSPRRKLQIGDAACEVEYRNGDFTMTVGGKAEELIDNAGLGYQSLQIPAGGNSPYLLAFPRGYSYKDEGRLYCRSGTVQTGTVDGVELRLYDDDLAGRYRKGNAGVSVGDGGGMGIFGTLSDLLPTPNAVYAIQKVANDGSSITLRKYAGPTGRLILEPGNTNVECRMAFASEDGKCSFGLLAGSQGTTLTLPTGKYRFLYGFVYRPAARHVVCLILPSSNVPVVVGNGEEVSVVLGDMAKREWPWGEGMVRMTFAQVLGLDLTGVETACNAGDFAKGQKLFDEIAGKYKSGPNYEVAKPWMEELRQRLVLETSPEDTALREAEGKLLAAVKDGKLDEAKALLPEVQNALAKIPAKFADSWPYKVHKLRVANMEKYAAGTAQPGLKLTVGKNKTETAEAVDYYVAKAPPPDISHVYEGFLIAPQAGEYELALESLGEGSIVLDGNKILNHLQHLPEERTVKVNLTEGPHALKVSASCYIYAYSSYGGNPTMVRLRWTPPNRRKSIVPAWAFEYKEGQAQEKK